MPNNLPSGAVEKPTNPQSVDSPQRAGQGQPLVLLTPKVHHHFRSFTTSNYSKRILVQKNIRNHQKILFTFAMLITSSSAHLQQIMLRL